MAEGSGNNQLVYYVNSWFVHSYPSTVDLITDVVMGNKSATTKESLNTDWPCRVDQVSSEDKQIRLCDCLPSSCLLQKETYRTM